MQGPMAQVLVLWTDFAPLTNNYGCHLRYSNRLTDVRIDATCFNHITHKLHIKVFVGRRIMDAILQYGLIKRRVFIFILGSIE